MINIVIPTYRRNNDLFNLLERFSLSTIPVTLHIYDNEPNNNISTVLTNLENNKLKIIYTQREQNIGPVLNFFFSLKDCSQKVTSKYISIISDDDLCTTEYLKELNKFEHINEIYDFLLFNNLILFNEKTNKYSLRGYTSSYDNIINKHTTITGTTFSILFLKSFFSKYTTGLQELSQFMYPMTFIFLHSKKYKHIDLPCLIHITDNTIYWYYNDHFNRFFLFRLHMFQICSQNKTIDHNDFLKFSFQLVKRAPISYFFKLFISI